MQNKYLKKLGKNVRAIRLERGWTQEKLAEAAGIHPVYISYIEQGTRNPSITKILQIARALGCEAAQIFQGLF